MGTGLRSRAPGGIHKTPENQRQISTRSLLDPHQSRFSRAEEVFIFLTDSSPFPTPPPFHFGHLHYMHITKVKD